jgi:pimeloyl-ACP methyl ester carboxylesterase
LFLLGLAGLSCLAANGWLAATEPELPRKRGVVFVVGGVGGFDVVGAAAQWALPRAGVTHEIRDYIWTHGWGRLFQDLQDVRYLLDKADDLAAQVRRVKEEDPDRPVYLVGKSGGAGLALAAAERLPPATLERIILLSAAVSPTYDLRPALRATKGEVVSFYSIYDRLVLGWGTSKFGTVDRVYGISAGLRGFVVPKGLTDGDRALYDRLVQLPWKPGMIFEGHLGNHSGTSMPSFVAKEVGPWLKP